MSTRSHRLKLLLIPALLVFVAGGICTLLVQLIFGTFGGGVAGFLEDEYKEFEKLAISSVESLVSERIQQSRTISSTRILLFDFATYGGAQSRTNNLGRLFAEQLRESDSLLGIRWQHSESGQSYSTGSSIDPESFGWKREIEGVRVYGPVTYNEMDSLLITTKIVGVNGRVLGDAFYLYDATAFRQLVKRGIPRSPRLSIGLSDRATETPLFSSKVSLKDDSSKAYSKVVPIANTPWNLHIRVSGESSILARMLARMSLQNILSVLGLSIGVLLILGIAGRAVLSNISKNLSVATSTVSDRDLVELQVLQQQFKESLFNLRQVVERIGGINEIVAEEESLAEAHRYSGMISQEIEGLRELISFHGEFANADFDKQPKVDFSLPDVLRGCVEGLKLRASGRQVKIVWKEEKLPATVRGNRTILRQCLLSGLENVLQQIKSGERLSVDTGMKDGQVSFQFTAPVSDEGNFVEKRNSFSTRVKRFTALVEYLKGSCEHSFAQDKVLLKIQIPMEVVESAEGQVANEVQDEIVHIVGYLMENPMRVLVVEDVILNSTLLKRMLEKWNCSVKVANDGHIAVDTYSGDSNFDLILMDLEMPTMNGIEATRQIRSYERGNGGKQIPIVALTGHSDKAHEEACRKVGMNGYLTKPVNGKHLGRLLYELKKRQKAAQA